MTQRRWFKSYPNGVEPNLMIDVPNRSLVDFLESAVKERPNQSALIFENKSYTYAALVQDVRKIAFHLMRRGVKKGTRVALMMNNCPELILSYYAVLYAGGMIVQNNPMYKERELKYQIDDSGAEYIIIEHNLLQSMPQVNEFVQHIIVARTPKHEVFDTLADYISSTDIAEEKERITPKEDIAVIQYTGGTTGVSKGVKLTHHNLVSNVVQTHQFLGVNSKKGQERILNVLPLFHVYGMTVSMNYCFFLQSTLYLVERFKSDEILSLIDGEKITMFPGTPTIYIASLDNENIAHYDLSSIHTCISGSAPLSVETKLKFEKITGAKLVDAYGLSEASPVTHSNPVNGVQKPGSMGVPVPGTDSKIVDVASGVTELPVNEPGELIVKGPQVMQGYWQQESETKNSLRNGWLYTGDIAYMDKDGYFFIVSRKKDMIIASGYNIYPREIEEVLYEHPAIHEVVVCGIPDAYRGETVKAFIVKEKGYEDIGKEDLIEYCKSRLSRYKVPTHLKFLRALPKSSVGKILRRELIQEDKYK